jgi:hypothetical protein
VFELSTPLKVQVFEGRIRGQQKKAIEIAIPKYDEAVGAYVTPDGGAVQVRGDRLVDIPMPERPDAGMAQPFEAAAAGPPRPLPVPAGNIAMPPRTGASTSYDSKAVPNPKAKPATFYQKPEG